MSHTNKFKCELKKTSQTHLYGSNAIEKSYSKTEMCISRRNEFHRMHKWNLKEKGKKPEIE